MQGWGVGVMILVVGCAAAPPRARTSTSSAKQPATLACQSAADCPAPTDPQVVVYCTTAGRCATIDLRRSPLTSCARDADCAIRPRGCCACGAREWIAVRARSSSDYEARVCGRSTDCPECVGHPPALDARCIDTHCETRVHTGHDSVIEDAPLPPSADS